jgi:peptide/nickel transport system substrate-binding protein
MAIDSRSWLAQYAGRRITRRKFLGTAAAGAGAAALIACGGDEGGGNLKLSSDKAREPGSVWLYSNNWKLEDETKNAVSGGTYRGSWARDNATGYDPYLGSPAQTPFQPHVYEFIMGKRRAPGVDPSSQEYGTPVPTLAESMEFAPDGASVTFTMRQNVKFHPIAPVNGRVMDIDDWKTSFDRFMAVSAQRSTLQDILDKVEYPDARHMVLKMKYPYAPFRDLIPNERVSFQIMPKELNADPNLAASVAIGTGFKMIDKHQPSQTIEFKKHAQYWDREPFIDRWHFPIIPEYANRYAQFVTGNIMAFTPTARDVITMTKDAPGAIVVGEELPKARIPRFNFGRENAATRAYKDARVRIAIRRSINWPGIFAVQSNKSQFEAAGIPVEVQSTTHASRDALWWLDPEKGELGAASANYQYNVAEAKKLVQAAGHSTPPEFNWMILVGVDGAEEEIDRLMIDSLNQSANFKTNLIATSNQVQERNCRSLRQCDAFINTGGSEYWMDYFMREQHSGGNRPGGEPVYPSAEIDRIANEYRKTVDQAKSVALIKEYQMFQANYMSMVPGEHVFTVFSMRWPWVHNASWGAAYDQELSGRDAWGAWGAHLAWLDKDMPRRNG